MGDRKACERAEPCPRRVLKPTVLLEPGGPSPSPPPPPSRCDEGRSLVLAHNKRLGPALDPDKCACSLRALCVLTLSMSDASPLPAAPRSSESVVAAGSDDRASPSSPSDDRASRPPSSPSPSPPSLRSLRPPITLRPSAAVSRAPPELLSAAPAARTLQQRGPSAATHAHMSHAHVGATTMGRACASLGAAAPRR